MFVPKNLQSYISFFFNFIEVNHDFKVFIGFCYNSVSILCFGFMAIRHRGSKPDLAWYPPPTPPQFPTAHKQKVKSEPLTTRKVPSPISLIIMAVKSNTWGPKLVRTYIFQKESSLLVEFKETIYMWLSNWILTPCTESQRHLHSSLLFYFPMACYILAKFNTSKKRKKEKEKVFDCLSFLLDHGGRSNDCLLNILTSDSL